MRMLPVRLHPGDDLRRALEVVVAGEGAAAAFVLSGIGSLRPAMIRLAGAEEVTVIDADTELLTLSGTIAAQVVPGPGSSHLHLSVADAQGRVIGGHAGYGCIVRTTAEVLLALLPGWHFSREIDPVTGWAELAVRRQPGR
ncbi:PPC domain-containing DNA-binding protein [Variovorax robiniae]|uniref:PPC domain-containing DNA-binding protein n=1 Tax=Variovorax robiniae TaxID=1836199 RepID=A0ABU8XI02_9BURK